MVLIREEFLTTIELTKDEFSWIWIVLMVVGAFLAGLGINFSRKKKRLA